MTSEPLNAADGLPARPSQPYATEKLHYVAHYQTIFAQGMKGKWPNRIYIDLLAGPGRCRIRDTGEEFKGSPILSFEAPFTTRIFVEAEPSLAAALRQRATGPCRVIEADCNRADTIAKIREQCPSNALGLAFIDNLGLDVSFSTIAALTRDRRIDLMVVMQLQDLTRNVQDVLAGRDDRRRVDDFFGGPAWESRSRQLMDANASAGEVASGLVTFYGEQLGTIGYSHVAESRTIMKNSVNAAQYRLVLAGKHEKAIEFFRKIEKIDPRGQRALGFE